MPATIVVNSLGVRSPFARRHLLGSLVETGVPSEIAIERVRVLVNAIELIQPAELTTDKIRHALDVIAGGEGAAALAAVIRGGVDSSSKELTTSNTVDVEVVFVDDRAPAVRVTYLVTDPTNMVVLIRAEDDHASLVAAKPLTMRAGDFEVPLADYGLREGVAHTVQLVNSKTSWAGPVHRVPVLMCPRRGPLFDIPPVAPAQPTPEELERELNELRENYERYAEVLQWFPLWRLSRILRALGKFTLFLGNLGPDALWRFIQFIRCNAAALDGLATEDIKRLMELMLEQARLELELCPQERAQERAALEALIQRLEAELASWDPTLTPEQSANILRGIKLWLLAEFPALLATMAAYWDEIVDEVDRLGPSVARWYLSNLIKNYLKIIIEKIIRKYCTEEVAKRLVPWIGLAVNVAEFLAIVALVEKLNSLAKAIDERMKDLVIALDQAGWPWPAPPDAYVWLDASVFGSCFVRICAFINCARRRPDGCTKWENCPATFEGGDHCSEHWLLPTAAQNGIYKIPFTLDDQALASSPCQAASGDPLLACYSSLRMEVMYMVDGRPRRLVRKLLVGAKT